MLSEKLLSVTNLGVDWVLWLLIGLSIVSMGIAIERAIFYISRGVPDADGLAKMLLNGDFKGVLAKIDGRKGLEAEVIRAAVENSAKGADAVDEVVASQLARSRLDYERRLAFLGTLGNNGPFIGLLGTVLGIIRASADLAAHPGASGVDLVITGISDALIATAVGLFVALPAVVMFNIFQRTMRGASQRATVLGRSVVANLKSPKPGSL